MALEAFTAPQTAPFWTNLERPTNGQQTRAKLIFDLRTSALVITRSPYHYGPATASWCPSCRCTVDSHNPQRRTVQSHNRQIERVRGENRERPPMILVLLYVRLCRGGRLAHVGVQRHSCIIHRQYLGCTSSRSPKWSSILEACEQQSVPWLQIRQKPEVANRSG